ncbi:restriction endonuclease subunit S [Shewanella algae]
MSQLNYLEKLLDGVELEWTTLGNEHAVEIANSGRKPVKAALRVAGETPYYGANNIQDYVDGYTHDGEFVLIAEDGSASLDNYSIQYATGRFWANNHVHVVRGKEGLNTRYLYHYLCIVNFVPFLSGGGRAKLTKGKLVDIPLPIPCPDNPKKSLAVQAEIVRILDAFTAMTAELTAELNMRKKQYNYYRDQLLSFEEGEVEWKTLEEVAHFANGKGHEKDISEDGKFIVVNSKFISTDGLVAKYSDSQICPRFKDDILLVMSDLPNGKALSKTFIVDEDERYTLNQRIGGITVKDKSEILPKFLHYYLDRTPQLLKHDNGVDQTNLRKGQILEVKVPILPLQKQEHIVSILDKFDKLTKSLSEGLPREIELRQKQYEYYRDLLLSFPKQNAEVSA